MDHEGDSDTIVTPRMFGTILKGLLREPEELEIRGGSETIQTKKNIMIR